MSREPLAAYWPGTDVEIELQPLGESERSELAATTGDDDQVVETLARAIRVAGSGVRMFDSAAELAAEATEEEIAALWAAYEDHRREVAPDLGDLGPDELERRIREWKAIGSAGELEAFRVMFAAHLFAYFGRPARELTELEVIEFAVIRAAAVKDAAGGRSRPPGARGRVTRTALLGGGATPDNPQPIEDDAE